ncbi:hypothetical protein A1O1_03947 [Capronia coronata CBS 617.96]|uniref:Uncharacterized protein n=1 Tax=Capronia coronata CBS 617.96 TaxID=1182541 RepID=W9YDC4_9EURO|nr:uncharacterized protein A1O1_03947 [Capronia coronata CBS 617.96]EXJ90842.1 hypothetical protein A1O1_03947 [Capronia coronata CBS 617.96]
MTISLNPRAPKPDYENAPREATGPIAADSLAAESLSSKGGFSENTGAAAQSVRGAQSTFANTDTSGAHVLHPAPSGAVREKQDALSAGADEKGTTGLKLDAAGKPNFDGVHNADGYYGGAGDKGQPLSQGSVRAGDSDFGATTFSSRDTVNPEIRSTGSDFDNDNTSGGGFSSSTGVRPHVDAAPGYVSNVTGEARPDGTYKPKGSNLDDADVSGSIPKTKTFTGNVGGQYDPGRVAEREFEGRNTGVETELSSSGVAGGRQRQQGSSGAVGEQGGQYGVLESERA